MGKTRSINNINLKKKIIQLINQGKNIEEISEIIKNKNSKVISPKFIENIISNYQSKRFKIINLRALIVGKHLEGKSIPEISKEVQRPYKTVQRIIKKYNETHDINKNRHGQGRKEVITKRIKTRIKNLFKEDCSRSYKDISILINKPQSTTSRYLRKVGYQHKPKYYNYLSEKNRLKRIEYCKKILKRKTLSDIIFTDECMIKCNRHYVKFFHYKGEPRRGMGKLNPENQLHIWGSISHKGPIAIFFVKKLTGPVYKNLLIKNFIPKANAKYGKNNWVFQQDNAGAHKEHSVMKYFKDENIKLIDHPAQSPDLNPIESVWSYLKPKVSKFMTKYIYQLNKKKRAGKLQETLKDAIDNKLQQVVVKEFKNLKVKYLKKTINHLYEDARIVLENNGWYKEYLGPYGNK